MGSDNLGAAWLRLEREDMAAFMEKRPPTWIPANLTEA